MHVSGHAATYRTSVTANMNLVGQRFFLVSLSYRYRVQCDRGLSLYPIFHLSWIFIALPSV